jgi:hypothetical protein
MYIYDVMPNDSVKPFSCTDILSLTDKESVGLFCESIIYFSLSSNHFIV